MRGIPLGGVFGQRGIGSRLHLRTKLLLVRRRNGGRGAATRRARRQLTGFAVHLQPAFDAGQTDLEDADDLGARQPLIEGGQDASSEIDRIWLHGS